MVLDVVIALGVFGLVSFGLMTVVAGRRRVAPPVDDGALESRSLGGKRCTVSTTPLGTGRGARRATQLRVEAGFPDYMTIDRERLKAKVKKALGGEDAETGDPAFDDLVLLRGETPAVVTSVLDAEVRAALVEALRAYDVELDGGDLVLSIAAEPTSATKRALVEAATAVLRPLQRQARTVVSRLEAIAFHDPLPRVRQLALERLRSVASPGQLTAVGRRALTRRDPATLVLGASILRDDAAIAALRRVVGDARVDEVTFARAAALLAELAPASVGDGGQLSVVAEADGGALSMAERAGSARVPSPAERDR